MGDVGGDHEAVGEGLGDEIRDGLVGCEGGDGALDGAGEEVAFGALAEETANLFIVEAADDFDDAVFCVVVRVIYFGCVGGGGDESFDGGKGA